MKPQIYAKELAKSLGLWKALEVSKQSRDALSPLNWSSLAVGPSFHTKNRKGKYELNKNELSKIHSQWVEVHNLLRKMK